MYGRAFYLVQTRSFPKHSLPLDFSSSLKDPQRKHKVENPLYYKELESYYIIIHTLSSTRYLNDI